MKRRKRYFKLFILLLSFGMLACLAVAPWWIVNNPAMLQRAIAAANRNISWKIAAEKFEWSPLKRRIEISKIELANSAGTKKIEVGSAGISYRMLGILRGRLIIESLKVDGLRIEAGSTENAEQKTGRKRLNIAKLILLKKIEIENGTISNVAANFGKEMSIVADEVDISVLPAVLGDTEILFDARSPALSKGEKRILSAAELNLRASTELSKWNFNFPYLNAIEGHVKAAGIGIQDIDIKEADADITLYDGNIELGDLLVRVGENELAGEFSANAWNKEFDMEINIPKPVKLPYIGKDLDTFDTAGEVSGKIKLTGSGFVPSESNGKGNFDVAYRFSAAPDVPVSIAGDAEWSDGVLDIKNANAKAGENPFTVGGTLSIPGKHFRFDAKGEQFPVERVFGQFKNPHLKKIFGPADFEGFIEGWAKKFTSKVTGTVHGGGWRPITAEKTEVVLETTYDDLKLTGNIFSGDKQTGRADLSIHFGPKIGDKDRNKTIDFSANVKNHPVGDSLAAFGLSGTGTAEIWIKGPHTAFNGAASGTVDNGGFHGTKFDRAAAKLDISRQKLIFSDMELKFSDAADLNIKGTVIGDIDPSKIRFHGIPAAGLFIDATYRHADGKWIVADISYENQKRAGEKITATGTAAVGGQMDLKIKGSADLGDVAETIPIIDGGEGPIDVDMVLRGTGTDPKLSGRISFQNNKIIPKDAGLGLENLSGTAKFEGSRIIFEDVSAKIDDGELKFAGHVDHKNFAVSDANIKLEGRGMRYRNREDGFEMEFDGKIALTGAFPNPLLKGEITILDGKYTKDFTLIEALTGSRARKEKAKRETATNFNPRLELKARTSGDFRIRNNVGDIWLNVDIGARGNRKNPIISGSIDALGGKIHYLGLEFDLTKGFVEFKERYSSPYFEAYAQKEVGAYNVTLTLHGPTDNLVLDLSSSSPTGVLDKKDTISLLMFGVTEAERSEIAERAGSQFTSSLVGQAITGVVGQPIMRMTGLDVFRLEAAAADSPAVSRVYLGKQISDRLSVNFSTDVNTMNATQTFVGEYLITDNLLIRGSRSSDASYKLSGAMRFKLR